MCLSSSHLPASRNILRISRSVFDELKFGDLDYGPFCQRYLTHRNLGNHHHVRLRYGRTTQLESIEPTPSPPPSAPHRLTVLAYRKSPKTDPSSNNSFQSRKRPTPTKPCPIFSFIHSVMYTPFSDRPFAPKKNNPPISSRVLDRRNRNRAALPSRFPNPSMSQKGDSKTQTIKTS